MKKLAKKDYQSYLQPGHKMLDYVIMFVPVYSALRLAYEADRNLWHDAYAQGVLITTEETLMPFLRMINIAWTSHEQVANQQQIITYVNKLLVKQVYIRLYGDLWINKMTIIVICIKHIACSAGR